MAQPDQAAAGGKPTSRRRAEFQRHARALLLLEAATSDAHLGCYNRAYLARRGREEVARRVRYGHRLSVLVLAADGGADPDEARLKALVAMARLALRPTDIMGRWHAGELVVLLPSTGLAGAGRLARRLSAGFAAEARNSGVPLAASIGIATALGRQEGLELLLLRARAGLEEARLAGGNRVGIG